MDLAPGTKLLIFGPEGRGVLTLVRADMVTKLVRRAMARLSEFEQLVKEAPAGGDETD